MTPDDLIGTWTITGFLMTAADGTASKPWGDDVSGLLIYTADGFVSGILGPTDVNAEQPGFGYSGRYEIVGNDVHHHVMASNDPKLIGSKQVRGVEFRDDELILTSYTSLAFGEGYTGTITWRRAD